jgi:hypothetical protein
VKRAFGESLLGAAVILSVIAVCPGGQRALAGSASRKAAQIIRKHIKARGGMKTIKAIENVKVTGYVQSEGLEVDFTLWLQRPNRGRIEVTVHGLEIIQAYDGEVAWWINPLAEASEPKEMPEAFARAMHRWTEFDGPLVNYKKKRHRVEYVGQQGLREGGTAHKIKLTRADGEVWHVFIHTETYLEVMRTYEQTYRGDTTEVNTYFSDFTEVEGLKTPRVIEGLAVTGTPFKMVFETIDTGVRIDKAFFTMAGALDAEE